MVLYVVLEAVAVSRQFQHIPLSALARKHKAHSRNHERSPQNHYFFAARLFRGLGDVKCEMSINDGYQFIQKWLIG